MAKMTEEKKIQNAAIKHATGKGIPTIRMFFGPGIQTGWPDVLFLIPGGRPLFIEFKAPGETPTKKQEKKIATLRELNYDVCWTDDRDEAKEMIDQALAAAKESEEMDLAVERGGF